MLSSALDVTGLVLHFRTPERTLACMRSLAYDGLRRIVVVDNSEDGGHSAIAMQGGLDALCRGGVEVRWLSPPHNLGFAAGTDLGLGNIADHDGAHALVINSDATLEPGALARMIPLLANALVVVPQLSQDGAAPSSSFAYYDRTFGLITRRPWGSAVRHPSGCCLLIRREMAHRSLFDTDFFFYGEDVAFGAFLMRHGFVVADCREAVVRHAGSASAKNGSMFYEYHMNRAHWLLGAKLANGWLQRVAFTSARCLSLAVRAMVRSCRFRSVVPLRGLFAATADVLRGHCRSFTPPPD